VVQCLQSGQGVTSVGRIGKVFAPSLRPSASAPSRIAYLQVNTCHSLSILHSHLILYDSFNGPLAPLLSQIGVMLLGTASGAAPT
jgi:hypothetical protein